MWHATLTLWPYTGALRNSYLHYNSHLLLYPLQKGLGLVKDQGSSWAHWGTSTSILEEFGLVYAVLCHICFGWLHGDSFSNSCSLRNTHSIPHSMHLLWWLLWRVYCPAYGSGKMQSPREGKWHKSWDIQLVQILSSQLGALLALLAAQQN